jgi:hypothetical protein
MHILKQYLRANALACALTVMALLVGLAAPPMLAAHSAVVLGTVGGVATATFDMTEAMKVVFEDTLDTNVVTDSELLDLIEKDTGIKIQEGSDGRYIETAQLFGLPAGYGYRTESDPVPVPSGPVIKNARINLKKSVGSVGISGDNFKKIQQGKAAFVNWSRQQFPALVQRMTNEKDRIMLGYGVGVKAKVATIDGVAKTITVDSAAGITGLSNAVLHFLMNEQVAFGPNIDGTALRANAAAGHNVLVNNVDLKTGLIYLSEIPVALGVGDFCFPSDSTTTSSVDANGDSREFMGLFGHVDDGSILLDYFGIARDDYFAWQGIVVDVTGAPYNGTLTEDALIEGDRQARLYGGAKIDVVVASYDGQNQFWKDLRNDRAINDPRVWTGGAGKLKMILGDRVVDVRGARKLPPEVAFGLSKGTFRRYTLGKFEWVNRTGSMWQPVTTGGNLYDAFRAYGTDYDEIFCKAPNQNIRFKLG